MIDHDEINNRRIKRIAKAHHCTVPDVNKALDHHPIELDRPGYLRRLLALELVELDELGEVFRAKALAGDCVAGALLAKIFERRATLLGLNAPAGHAVTLNIHAPAEPRQTSTERIRQAIERIAATRPNGDGSQPAE